MTILLLFALLHAAAAGEPPGPKQPIEFNHKLHVTDLKQPCALCHADRDPGELVAMPEVSDCWRCHATIQRKSGAEHKLAAFAKQSREVDWVRVYQIPSYVRFDHRRHANAGVQCEACHGAVGQRLRLWQEREMSMGSCMNCHRQMHASLDCGSCHSVR
ncbi:MAG TPA: cytochrome c3 family protein [Bryobacteraceae bacterium]